MDHSTFVMLKPDALEAKLQEKILDMFREHGISVLKKKTVTVDEATILAHYAEVIERLKDAIPDFPDCIRKEFVGKQVEIIELATRHHDIIPKVREIVGATDPAKADPNSIRGKYATDTMAKSNDEKRMLRNLVHASDSEETAKKELALWFKSH